MPTLAWVLGFVLSTLAAQVPASRPSVEEALRLAGAGRAAEAEQMLRVMERTNPGDPEIRYRLGLVLLRNGKLAQARSRLESAAKLTSDPLVWLALAQARLRMDDLPGALKAADHARKEASAHPIPDQALALFDAEVIKYHLRKGNALEATGLAQKAVETSNLPLFHHLLGKAYELNNDPASAVAELQQAIQLDPNQANYYLEIAQLFLNHNTPEPAELVLVDATRRFPQNAEALRLLGLARYGLGKTDEALDTFLQAIDAAPEMEAAYASLETLLPSAGSRVAEIIPRLRHFAKTKPSSPLGPYLLALVVPDESEALLRKSIRASPDFWPAWFELHKVLKAQEKREESLAALRKTVTLKRDFAPAYYALAEYYSRAGDHARAAQAREQHHKLLAEQRAAAEKQRAEAPRLTYTLSER